MQRTRVKGKDWTLSVGGQGDETVAGSPSEQKPNLLFSPEPETETRRPAGIGGQDLP